MSEFLINPFMVAAPAAFDPLADVTWEAVYWANDPGWTNPGDGNPVTTWDDASGNNRDQTGTGSERPTFRATVANLNNRAAVEFDGTDDFMSNTSGFTVAQPFTIVAVVSAWATGDAPDRLCGASAGNVQVGHGYPGATDVSLYAGGADFRSASTGFDATSAHLVTVRFNGASSAIGIDGSAPATVSATPGNAGIDTDFVLANRSDADRDGAVKIAFLGIYNGEFSSDADYSNFKAWVASYYGLTIA